MPKSLIIIGCGPGGYATAEYAAKEGMTVTVFEKGEAGGTCLNRGCIPTKVYCHAATLVLDNAQAAGWGLWQSAPPAIDFARLHAHKDAVVAQRNCVKEWRRLWPSRASPLSGGRRV